MALLVLSLVLSLVATVAIGYLAHRSGRSIAGGPHAWGAAAAARFGAVPAAIAVVAIGGIVTFVLMLPLGLLARSMQHSVDEPVYRAVSSRVDGSSKFTKFNNYMTLLGDRAVVDVMIVVALTVLCVAYGRRWWIPAGLVLAIALIQYEGQVRLARIIDRGTPPVPGSGTFPSGGVSRLIAVYGAIAVLVVLLMPGLSRLWQARIWTGVMLFGVTEAFTRIYLSQHWFTDALAGLVFGGLLMLTAQIAGGAIGYQPPRWPQPADHPATTTTRHGVDRPA